MISELYLLAIRDQFSVPLGGEAMKSFLYVFQACNHVSRESIWRLLGPFDYVSSTGIALSWDTLDEGYSPTVAGNGLRVGNKSGSWKVLELYFHDILKIRSWKMTSSSGKSWRSTAHIIRFSLQITVCSVIFGFLFSQGLLLN